MVKLIKCNVCGKEMAKTTVSCPHCGAKHRDTSEEFVFKSIKAILLVILIVISLPIVLFILAAILLTAVTIIRGLILGS